MEDTNKCPFKAGDKVRVLQDAPLDMKNLAGRNVLSEGVVSAVGEIGVVEHVCDDEVLVVSGLPAHCYIEGLRTTPTWAYPSEFVELVSTANTQPIPAPEQPFKVGDRVRILRDVRDFDIGSYNNIDEFDSAVGEEGVVEEVTDCDALVSGLPQECGSSWYYLFEDLELVNLTCDTQPTPAPEQQFNIGDRVRVLRDAPLDIGDRYGESVVDHDIESAVGEVGVVTDVHAKGWVTVQGLPKYCYVSDESPSWEYPPEFLELASTDAAPPQAAPATPTPQSQHFTALIGADTTSDAQQLLCSHPYGTLASPAPDMLHMSQHMRDMLRVAEAQDVLLRCGFVLVDGYACFGRLWKSIDVQAQMRTVEALSVDLSADFALDRVRLERRVNGVCTDRCELLMIDEALLSAVQAWVAQVESKGGA